MGDHEPELMCVTKGRRGKTVKRSQFLQHLDPLWRPVTITTGYEVEVIVSPCARLDPSLVPTAATGLT